MLAAPVEELSQASWHDLRWWEWVGTAGVVLSIVGLVFTYFQARDAKSAAEAAETASDAARIAATATKKELSTRQALILIPRLRTVALELDEAVSRGDETWIRRRLESWRWESGHLHGLLSKESPRPAKLLQVISAANALASIAEQKGGGGGGDGVSPDEHFEKAVIAVKEACTELTVWSGARSAEIGTE